AEPKVAARKKTQPTHTPRNVARKRSTVPGGDCNRRSSPGRGLQKAWKERCPTNQAPCRAPQATKVQLAPCHNPPRAMVISRLRLVWRVVPRLPPRGMNR